VRPQDANDLVVFATECNSLAQRIAKSKELLRDVCAKHARLRNRDFIDRADKPAARQREPQNVAVGRADAEHRPRAGLRTARHL
jgi:hypothetical protein